MCRVIFVALLFTSVCAAVDPMPGELILTSSNGKNEVIKPTKFLAGIRKINFGPKESAFVFRDENSTNYARGVETWLLISQLQTIKFDPKAQQIQVQIQGWEKPLVGSTQFKGMNVLSLEVGKERYSSTVGRDKLIQAIRFPTGMALPRPGGSAWRIEVDQPKSSNPKLVVHNVKVLSQLGGNETLTDEIPCHKGSAIRLNSMEFNKLELLAVDSTRGVAMEVHASQGMDRTIFAPLNQNKTVLLGIVGEVPGGYQYFPWHTIRFIEPLK